MEDIVKKNVLDAIHSMLKLQNQHIDASILEEADKEIIPYLERNFSYDKNEFKIIHHGMPILVNDKRIFDIFVRYYAICQNNLGLLEKLKEEKYNFFNGTYNMNFYSLDKQLTSKFKEKDYIRYLKKNDPFLRQFYNSLMGIDKTSREKIMKDFSEIVKRDHSVMNVGSKDGNYNYLSAKNIELFGKDFLVNLNHSAREIFNSFYFTIDENEVGKVKRLLEEYSNSNISVSLYRDGLKYFTIDELAIMSSKDVRLYEDALRRGLIERMKSILTKKPEFDCPPEFIKKEIFKVLSDDEIINLSEDAIEKIANLNVSEIHDTLKLSVKKITGLVLLDRFRRMAKEKIYKIN